MYIVLLVQVHTSCYITVSLLLCVHGDSDLCSHYNTSMLLIVALYFTLTLFTNTAIMVILRDGRYCSILRTVH